jgi:uncharacterized protein (TIGR00369 family)
VSNFIPLNPNFENWIQTSFNAQAVMKTLGATVQHVQAGQVQIHLPFSHHITQHNGFLHAGIVTTIVDNACGYAAFTLMPADSAVLTVEFKVNFLSPAQGNYFVATGQVLKAGKTLTVCEGRVVAYTDTTEKLIAAMQATMICLNNSS